jgi:hypothetical protein
MNGVMTVKQGDTKPRVWTVNMDLTGSTVRLLAREQANLDPIELEAAVTDAAAGEVTWTPDGTLNAVRHWVEVEVTQGGTIVTAPSDGYATLRVIADID